MSKKNNTKLPKSYKSLLSKLYFMILIIVAGAGASYYILQLNTTLQHIYQPDGLSDSPIVTIQDIDQSTTNIINSLHPSTESVTPTLPAGTRVNPFN